MSKNNYFPLFIDLSDDRILVVGGGNVALRKTRTLQRFCGRITVVAPDILPDFAALEGVTCIRRGFESADLEGVRMAIIATNDRELNAEIASMCRAEGILKNVASDRTLCDFYFPAIADLEEDLVVGISSGGDPARTRQARERLEQLWSSQ